ncbi:MAG: FIST C-terminal domain-containing protein [Gammaproteobacteria bacterium]|nr:FIST C-terminal domain-containing protein [Gammaproteobacteria bacterium]
MTSTFQFAHASHHEIHKLLDECAKQLSGPFTQSLGLIYITDALHDQFPVILNTLKDHTGIKHWAGTVGTGIIGGQQEYYDEPAIAVMLCDLNEDDFTLLPTLYDNLLPFNEQASEWAEAHRAPLGLIHGDPSNPHLQDLLQQLGTGDTATQYAGGLSSSRGSTPQVCDTLTSGGLSGVLFSDQANIISNLSQGCTPITAPYTITQAEKNILVTLDEQPALSIFKEAIGEVLARDIQRTAGYIFAGIPTSSDNPNDYMIRHIIGVDESQQIMAIGDYVDNGQTLMFCRRDGNTAQQDMMRMLEELQPQLATAPRGGVYISCVARGRNQFGDNSEEVKMIHEVLGDFPLIGFHANGEIYNSKLYSFTGVLILFK